MKQESNSRQHQIETQEQQMYVLNEQIDRKEELLNTAKLDIVVANKNHKVELRNKQKEISLLQSQQNDSYQKYSDLLISSKEKQKNDESIINKLSLQVLDHQLINAKQQIEIDEYKNSNKELSKLSSKQSQELESIRKNSKIIIPESLNVVHHEVDNKSLKIITGASHLVTPSRIKLGTQLILEKDPITPSVVRIFYSEKKLLEDQTVRQGETAIFCGRDKHNKKYVRIFTKEYGINLMKGDFIECQTNDEDAGVNNSHISSTLFGVIPIITLTESDYQLLRDMSTCCSDSEESDEKEEQGITQKRRLE